MKPNRQAVENYCAAQDWHDHNNDIVAACSLCARAVRKSQLSLVTIESSKVPLGGPSAVVCRSCKRRMVS